MKALLNREIRWLRSRPALWVYVGFVVLLFFNKHRGTLPPVRESLGALTPVAAFQFPLAFLIPVGGVALGYRAIAGEREEKTARLLCAMPHSRSEIILSKLLGRSAVLTAIFTALILLAGVAVIPRDPSILLPAVALSVLSAVYLLQNVAVGIAASVLFGTPKRAGAAVFIYLITALYIWPAVIVPTIANKINSVQTILPAEHTHSLLYRFSPMYAYRAVTNAVFGVGNSGSPYFAAVLQSRSGYQTNALVVSDAPVYLTSDAGLLFILCWLLIPTGIAISRFREQVV